jgi:hypothetical protein
MDYGLMGGLGMAQQNKVGLPEEYARPLEMTVGENIERQIQAAEAAVLRLKNIKRNLEDSGLLKLKIADLQQAMQF